MCICAVYLCNFLFALFLISIYLHAKIFFARIIFEQVNIFVSIRVIPYLLNFFLLFNAHFSLSLSLTLNYSGHIMTFDVQFSHSLSPSLVCFSPQIAQFDENLPRDRSNQIMIHLSYLYLMCISSGMFIDLKQCDLKNTKRNSFNAQSNI